MSAAFRRVASRIVPFVALGVAWGSIAAEAPTDGLAEAVRAVASRVARLTGAGRLVAPAAVRATETERALAHDAVVARFDPSGLAARGRAWHDMGFGDASAPLKLVRLIVGDLDGMTLEPGARRLLVDPSRLTDRDFGPFEDREAEGSLLLVAGVRPDEPLAAHYLAHALAPDGRAISPADPPRTTDALLAETSWSEGMANLVALTMAFEGVGLYAEVAAGRISPATVLNGALVPPALESGDDWVRSFLFFIYEEGFAQASSRLRAGGWQTVTAAARERRATRDVLHPDRPALGAVAPDAPDKLTVDGFVAVDRDVLGEQGIVTLVSTATGKDDLGLQAGDGWLSDTLVRYERSAGDGADADGVTLWVSRWAGVSDATDFTYGMGRVFEARFGGPQAPPGEPTEKVVAAGERVVRMSRDGAVVKIRSAPASIDSHLGPLRPPAVKELKE